MTTLHPRPSTPTPASVTLAPTSAPDWLTVIRHAARLEFAHLGLPQARAEAWRYTSVQPLEALTRPTPPYPDAGRRSSAAPLVAAWASLTPCSLVLVNGHFVPELSRIAALPRGAVAGDLKTAVADDLPSLKALFDLQTHDPGRGLTALNTASFVDGVVLLVPAGVEVPEPIQVILIQVGEGTPTASQPRLVLSLGPESAATFIETHLFATTTPVAANVTTQVQLADGARLEHLRYCENAPAALHVERTEVTVSRDASYASSVFLAGGALSRDELCVALNGPGAKVVASGLSLGHGRDHLDAQTVVEHHAPHTTSDQLYKAVYDDHASGVFAGKVVVHPGAVKTDARQSNRNLLCADTAVADTRPQLEIYADDVKCSHGATVGALDPQALFYLQSRALGLDAARALLTRAFAAEALARVANPGVKAAWQRELGRRLGAAEGFPS
ncbi:MAG: Fe-S cluster assembly protein SufD [Deltaproteobacteria bacterium]|nr:Fe-S cluster assembly protein SufD [Deltaproteobacteria bacterium]